MMPPDVGSKTSPLPELIQMIWGFMASQAIYVASCLEIFDFLSNGEKSSNELAIDCEVSADALGRLLSFLSSLDLLFENSSGHYSLTERGDYLRSGHSQSIRGMALLYGQSFFWEPWGNLLETVKTGKPAFDRIYGEGLFDYLEKNPSAAAIFHIAMEGGSKISLQSALDAYDFSIFEKIVDVGGGSGAFLRGILKKNTRSKGVLCDLPSVVERVKSEDLPSRIEVVCSDMFVSVPKGGDAYIYKRILHDWDDDESVRILSNCRKAIVRHGRLLVIESVLKQPGQADPARWMDINMLVMLTGRERTEEDYRRIFKAAGFTLTCVTSIGRESIVEGRPYE
ncbi:putative transcriptional regulator [Rhodanobacter sp. ANJX3]|nr:putative transcriptional regulator [Rhodanobacter sp. ANJX3]